MAEVRRKALVQVFPKEEPDACGSKPACSMGCEGCGKGPSTSEALTLEGAVRLLRERYGDRVELRVAGYSTGASRARAAVDLNALLVAGGNELRVSVENLSEVLRQAGPVIAVNGKIASVIAVPTRTALERMLGTFSRQQSPA